MSYWRMQLHPNEPKKAAYYASQSISAGFIGLDFDKNVGDLFADNNQNILPGEKNYVAFAKDMKVGDKVLIIVHHFPFAVVEVDGEYNYLKRPEQELRVWFRHFRRIRNIVYYADYKMNAKSWQSCEMIDTISILKDPESISYHLIEEMTK